LVALAAVAAMAGAVVATTTPAGATSTFSFTRIAGADRYATSALVAQQAFATSSTVVLATGGTYPDALAASFLAGNLGAPILLTTPDLPLSPSTTSALATLGAKNIVLVGGTSAISQAEQNQLGQTTAVGGGVINVSRISGATRYDTMLAIDTASGTSVGVFQGKRTAIIVTGQNFPDALGAAPIAYAEKYPVILTQGDVLGTQAAQALTVLGIQQVLIAGGTGAVPAGVEAAINQMGIATLQRFAGIDRSETSMLMADWAISDLGFVTTGFDVASGDPAFGGADALSVGPLGGRAEIPTLITDSVGNAGSVVNYAAEHSATLVTGTAIGGTGPLPGLLLSAITNAAVTGSAGGSGSSTSTPIGQTGVACGTSPSIGTSGSSGEGGSALVPELSSVSLISLTTPQIATPTNPEGTLLRYTFSTAITGSPAPVPASFLLTTVTGGAAGAGSTAIVEPGNTTSVDVLFPTVDTQALYDGLGLASVNAGGVTSVAPGLVPGADGAAPIGGHVTLVAGHTDAPDITAYGGFRTGAVLGQVMVDLTFDCDVVPLPTTVTNGYFIVLNDNSTLQCTGPAPGNLNPNGGTSPGGAGTTVITVACPEPTTANNMLLDGRPLAQANVARVFIAPQTVQDSASGAHNPLESVGATPTTGTWVAPDLTSATAAPNTVVAGVTVDQVTYNFDQPVLSTGGNGPVPADFGLFAQTGFPPVGVVPALTTPVNGDQNAVLATFPAGTLTNVVGAFVVAGAVHGAVGLDLPNQPASYGITGETLQTPTNTPDLVSATIASATTVVYTFDKAPVAPVGADFHLYTASALGVLQPIQNGGAPVVLANTVTVTFGSTTGAFLATVDAGGAGNAASEGFNV